MKKTLFALLAFAARSSISRWAGEEDPICGVVEVECVLESSTCTMNAPKATPSFVRTSKRGCTPSTETNGRPPVGTGFRRARICTLSNFKGCKKLTLFSFY